MDPERAKLLRRMRLAVREQRPNRREHGAVPRPANRTLPKQSHRTATRTITRMVRISHAAAGNPAPCEKKARALSAGLRCIVAAKRYVPPESLADLVETVPWLPKQYDPIWKFSHVSEPNV